MCNQAMLHLMTLSHVAGDVLVRQWPFLCQLLQHAPLDMSHLSAGLACLRKAIQVSVAVYALPCSAMPTPRVLTPHLVCCVSRLWLRSFSGAASCCTS